MRVIEPYQLHAVKRKRQRRKLRKLPLVLLLIFCIGIGVGVQRFRRPLPDPTVTLVKLVSSPTEPLITWPTTGQAAIGASGYGLLTSTDNQKPVPTASTAKIITALIVLDKKPLRLGQQGDQIAITENDVAIYNKYVAQQGSVLPVQVGGTLTEYQALQALLIVSANNIAEGLANWAFGSEAAYAKAANTYVRKHGLKQTTIADASGFSPNTVSTASDMVRLGAKLLEQPVLAEIVSQAQAELPMAGVITNTNRLLGQDGINGIKTGHTDEAGGCYIVSSLYQAPNGKQVTVVTAVMAAPTLIDAMNSALPLLTRTKQGFIDNQAITAGQRFATARSAWGTQAIMVAEKDASLFGWRYHPATLTSTITPTVARDRQPVGMATARLGNETASVRIFQNGTLGKPNFWWKLRRVFTN